MAIETEVHDAVEELLAAEDSAAIREWEAHNEFNEELFDRFILRLNRLLQDHRSVAHRAVDYVLVKAQELNNLDWQARLLVRKANLHMYDEHFPQALDVVNTAVAIFQSIGNKIQEARARSSRLIILTRLGMSKESLDDLSELEPMVENLNDARTSEVFSLCAGVAYHAVGRFEEAVPLWKKGIEIALQENDLDNAYLSYGHLAYGLSHLQRVDEALACYETAIAYATRNGFAMRAAVFNSYRAYLLFFQGKYRDSLEALKMTRVDLKERTYDLALLNLAESEIHLQSNLFEKAIELAESALQIFRRLGSQHGAPRVLILQGFAEGQLGKYEKADSHLREAKAMLHDQKNYSRAATADLYRAQLLLQNGHTATAEEVAEEARAMFEKEKFVGKAAYALMLIARCRMSRKDLAGAWKVTLDALRLNQQSPWPWLSYQLHQLVGDLHNGEGRAAQALPEYLQSLRESEELRGNLTQEESRLSFAHDKGTLFESVMKTWFDVNAPDSAIEVFNTLERAKSRTLADLMTHSVSVVCGNAFLRDSESAFNENSFLQLYESGAASPKPISLPEIQKTLGPETALIEYFVLNGKVGAFVLRRDSIQVARDIGELSEVRRLTSLLDFQLMRFRLGDEYIRSNGRNLSEILSKQLRLLHATLLRPLETWLDGCSTCLIIPHGVLHRVPFHLLLDGDGYVIDKYAISYAPSATVFSLCSARPDSVSSEPLIVGVEDSQIPGVAEEISSLRELWPQAAVLQNESATYAGFRSHCEKANIVHIATHADFRQDNAMFSSIQLTDGSMNVADVYGLNMTTDLVTLSGCGTGRGALRSGDEIIGLVRGFLYAGARCLLVSLWDVHDGSTSEMMHHFYRHVESGKGFAEALQSAMRATREERPHPYYWGSFRLVGYAAPSRQQPVCGEDSLHGNESSH